MTSILVNSAAITSLQSLRATRSAISVAQEEISTGKKISDARDNPSSWAIAASMKSDKAVLSTINDSLALADSVLNVAAEALKNAISVAGDIKVEVVHAMQPGADQPKILTRLQQLGKQLTSIVTSATFAGVNLFDTSQTNPVKFVSAYSNGKGAESKLEYIEFPLSTVIDELGGHFGMVEAAQAANVSSPTDLTALSDQDLTAVEIDKTLTNVDKAITDLITYASIIGVTQARVSQQRNFMQAMGDALSTGISSLVDADMNETSTRLQALQTQQQLGVQSLSIANQNSQIILKLFQ